tara:strand:+ start:110 stop:493 length:384 start_codon:yes stop_codon:yes gene_type:complete
MSKQVIYVYPNHCEDNFGNIATVSFWKSIERAENALKSLKNCSSTVNCSDDEDCHHCEEVHNSLKSTGCYRSNKLNNCFKMGNSTNCSNSVGGSFKHNLDGYIHWIETVAKFISKYFTRGLSNAKKA